jgi:hypothetical protein
MSLWSGLDFGAQGAAVEPYCQFNGYLFDEFLEAG